ncbi:TetR/AcrR family transcriptional regulator C-terminal domain-containing protein [Actinomadura roseirufa]|uniref:TetR/AcrR family transcriptional regulator C-terminal domain-containing protein n=1 Tax=Actinomadura roseirufa TaxID=2094049 RepID=UPI0010415738|nr:TetR/AcrR family transcriptional regulator C-terminal domain-containing protein [Actinomadura roseirufa]
MPRDTDPIADSVWMRPERARRGRPQLSRGEIVAAAVALLDAEGLDGLSMRRLGAAIGAGATSLYFYVAHKDELLELALDEVMGEIALPDPAPAGWRAAAGDFARGFRTMILRHPWVVAQLGVQPALGPRAMRLSDRSVELFNTAGFDGATLAWASSLLMSHAIGAATTETAMRRMLADSGQDANELGDRFEPYLERIGAQYPNLAGWWRENRELDFESYQDEAFEFGLERLLDGLESWLARRR